MSLKLFLTLALYEGGWSTPRPGRITTGNNSSTSYTGACVSATAGLDGYGEDKISRLRGFEPQTVQYIASCYTGYSIPAP